MTDLEQLRHVTKSLLDSEQTRPKAKSRQEQWRDSEKQRQETERRTLTDTIRAFS